MTCACSQNKQTSQQTSLEYYYLFYDIDCCTTVDIEKRDILYSYSLQDSIYKLTYVYQREKDADTATYFLSKDTNFKPQLLLKSKKDSFFH
jgi:hypothetical protein